MNPLKLNANPLLYPLHVNWNLPNPHCVAFHKPREMKWRNKMKLDILIRLYGTALQSNLPSNALSKHGLTIQIHSHTNTHELKWLTQSDRLRYLPFFKRKKCKRSTENLQIFRGKNFMTIKLKAAFLLIEFCLIEILASAFFVSISLHPNWNELTNKLVRCDAFSVSCQKFS